MSESYSKKLSAELYQFVTDDDETGPARVVSAILVPCFHGSDGWFGLCKDPATNSWIEFEYQDGETKTVLAARIRERLTASVATQ
ncbi:MAG: hypothetical protein ABSF69_17810 [Polyangiaceae bacterium]|jgi:hypothetical protein